MITDILILVWLHFVADFVLQSDKMAKGKSKDNVILLSHVAVYSLPFLYFGIMYAIVNVFLHFCIDYVTSRATGKLWAKGEVHWFFVVIGLDQALHLTSLILTYHWMVNEIR